MTQPATRYCSFCGKSQHEVAKLITGPTVAICNECVVVCAEDYLVPAGLIALAGPRLMRSDDIGLNLQVGP